MEAMTIGTKVLIFLNLGVYIMHLILNGLSARAKKGNKLFPNTVSEVSKHFELEMTPVGATFSIWGVIFTWQVLWMIYTVVNVFRSSPAANILSTRFFVAFILNIVLISAWLFTWSRKQGVASFVIIVLGQILVDIAFASAVYDLEHFLNEEKIEVGKRDIWLQRILVQNGILFYGTWTTIATLINFAVVVSYYLGSSTKTASILSLSLLGVVATTWFILENFVFQKYTQYTFTAYIVLLIGLTGILANIFDIDKTVGGLTLALLLLSAIFMIARVAIIFFRTPHRFGAYRSNEVV